EGARCVSALLQSREQFVHGTPERDSFSFMLHDLIHASHFFRDENHSKKQIFFCRWMRVFSGYEPVDERIRSGKLLKKSFEYLIRDMNRDWIHSIKCLKSIMPVEFHPLCVESLDEFLGFSSGINASWEKLNSPEENEETRTDLDRTLSTFLM